jgi:hypothetical protein
MSSAVTEVYEAKPNPYQWSKQSVGVACLVRDMKRKSYFIRVVNPARGKIEFEQELYNEFKYNQAKPFFHTFFTATHVAALNFSIDADAEEVLKFFFSPLQGSTTMFLPSSFPPFPPGVQFALRIKRVMRKKRTAAKKAVEVSAPAAVKVRENISILFFVSFFSF